MAGKKTLTIQLSDLAEDTRQIIYRMIAEGRHRTADEVIAEALDRYREELESEAVERAMSAPLHGDYRHAKLGRKGSAN